MMSQCILTQQCYDHCFKEQYQQLVTFIAILYYEFVTLFIVNTHTCTQDQLFHFTLVLRNVCECVHHLVSCIVTTLHEKSQEHTHHRVWPEVRVVSMGEGEVAEMLPLSISWPGEAS